MRNLLRLLTLCCFVGCTVALSACGFAPLYAQQGLTSSMRQIGIEVPDTRTGYFLQQDLRNGFGGDDSSPKAYILTVKMNERHFSIGYKVDDTSTKSEVTSVVTYVLTNANTGKVLYKDAFTETVTYDTTSSPLTGVVSQQDAQERIAVAISQKIQINLALYFHDGVQGRTPPAISVQKDNPADRNPVTPQDPALPDSSSPDSSSQDSTSQ